MDYTAIETAVHDTLKADAWLGDAANVKTWSKGHRNFVLHEKGASLYFDVNDLPAVSVAIQPDSKRQEFNVTNELEETVTVEVQSAIYIAQGDHAAGEAQFREIIQNIERVLDGQRTSANNLGLDSECGAVNSTRTRATFAETDKHRFHLSTTEAEVQVISTF